MQFQQAGVVAVQVEEQVVHKAVGRVRLLLVVQEVMAMVAMVVWVLMVLAAVAEAEAELPCYLGVQSLHRLVVAGVAAEVIRLGSQHNLLQ